MHMRTTVMRAEMNLTLRVEGMIAYYSARDSAPRRAANCKVVAMARRGSIVESKSQTICFSNEKEEEAARQAGLCAQRGFSRRFHSVTGRCGRKQMQMLYPEKQGEKQDYG